MGHASYQAKLKMDEWLLHILEETRDKAMERYCPPVWNMHMTFSAQVLL